MVKPRKENKTELINPKPKIIENSQSGPEAQKSSEPFRRTENLKELWKERAECSNDLTLEIKHRPVRVNIRRYTFPLAAYPSSVAEDITSVSRDCNKHDRTSDRDTNSQKVSINRIKDKNNIDSDNIPQSPECRQVLSRKIGDFSENESSPLKIKENLVEMSSYIKPNEGPVLCKFIDDSGEDITQQVSQESSSRTRSLENRKSVSKLSTETTADPVKEDDQASDFGDFEEDDPRPKKRLSRRSKGTGLERSKVEDVNSSIETSILTSNPNLGIQEAEISKEETLRNKLLDEFKLMNQDESESDFSSTEQTEEMDTDTDFTTEQDTYKPTPPKTNPSSPTSKLTSTTSKPTPLTTKPAAPITKPTPPTSKSTPPTTNASPPPANPSPPTANPSPPTAKLTHTTLKPTSLTSKPTPPISKPTPPTSKHTPPTSKLTPSTFKPTPPTTKPPPTSKPTPATSKPTPLASKPTSTPSKPTSEPPFTEQTTHVVCSPQSTSKSASSSITYSNSVSSPFITSSKLETSPKLPTSVQQPSRAPAVKSASKQNTPRIVTVTKSGSTPLVKPTQTRIIKVTKESLKHGPPPSKMNPGKTKIVVTKSIGIQEKSRERSKTMPPKLAAPVKLSVDFSPLILESTSTADLSLHEASTDKLEVKQPELKVRSGEKTAEIMESKNEDRIISDHDYGFRSPDESTMTEETKKTSRPRGRPPGRKSDQPTKPLSKPGARLASLFDDITPSTKPKVGKAVSGTENHGAFSADDESSENETKAAPSSSSTVWSSFNIIFDAPAAKPAAVSVPSSQEEEPRSRDEEQKKNRDGTLLKKKKILRKVASSKSRVGLVETGTDTDEPGEPPTRRPVRRRTDSKPDIPARILIEKIPETSDQQRTSRLSRSSLPSGATGGLKLSPNSKSAEELMDQDNEKVTTSISEDKVKEKNAETKLEINQQTRKSGRYSEVESGESVPVKSSPTKPHRNIPEKTEDTKIFRRSLRDSSREMKDAKNDSSSLDSSLDFDNEKIRLLVPSSDTESGKLDTSQEFVYPAPSTPLHQLGDLVWVKFSSYPWWPSMITNDPVEKLSQKLKQKGGRQFWEYHVSFFGEPNRAWISEKSMIWFKGRANLEQRKEQEISKGVQLKVVNSLYSPKLSIKEKWESSVQGAEELYKLGRAVRIEAMPKYNTEQVLKRKREETPQESPSRLPASKRSKIQSRIERIVEKIPKSSLVEQGKSLTAFKLYILGLKASQDKLGDDTAKAKQVWDNLTGLERNLYIETKRSILENIEAEEAGNRRSMASRRQQELVSIKEEKEKKEAEKGPAWYYIPVGIKEAPVARVVTPDLLEYKRYERCCAKCESVTSEVLGEVWKCKGLCGNSYHLSCLGLNPKEEEEDKWKCIDCCAGILSCSLCGHREGETTASGLKCGPVRRCGSNGCGKWYHETCITGSPLWPQARVGNSSLICPAHMCHTCASDDPKNPVMKYKEKLIRCIRCPTAYHHNDHCMTAGTLIITKNDILCPKHYKPPAKNKKNFHVNASWCFMCSTGGSIICCEICPAAFHLECLKLEHPPEKYYCDNCETGRMPLYNEVVWAKIGAYRWWPALVVPPEKLPNKIEMLPHQEGEFPVQFLGSGDYAWINQGRAFLYEEGDSEKVPDMSSKSMDATFRRGLKSAEELYAAYTKEQSAREEKAATKRNYGSKPAPYVKLKSNRPYGNCPVYTVDPGDLHPCDCDPNKPGPCGEDSNCINRMLMFECHTQVCNAKDKCENMRFQKRQYPALKVHRAEGRGWGLIAEEPIKKSSFVIEYVGELITMEEYRNRMKMNQDSKEENYYYLTIDNNRMIDAGPKGNSARFMNHSCDPNCITQKWSVNGDTRVGLFTIKDVKVGEELTFNYQLESVGDVKKKCLCGAANCSGFIGEKPKNEKEDNKRKEQEQKKNNKKALKKLKKKEEQKIRKDNNAKIWESTCFRCHESGSLIQCEMGLCPKSYHLSCIGKETFPRGKWHCPWHYCIDCGKLVEGQNAWCIHCPNAYCRQHRDSLVQHPELSWICREHGDEMEFLIETLRSGGGIAEIFPSPNPTLKQISAWKRARGISEFVAEVTPVSECIESKGKRGKSRFSLAPESGTDTSRSESREVSVSRELQSRSETPSTLSTGSSSVSSSRPSTPVDPEIKPGKSKPKSEQRRPGNLLEQATSKLVALTDQTRIQKKPRNIEEGEVESSGTPGTPDCVVDMEPETGSGDTEESRTKSNKSDYGNRRKSRSEYLGKSSSQKASSTPTRGSKIHSGSSSQVSRTGSIVARSQSSRLSRSRSQVSTPSIESVNNSFSNTPDSRTQSSRPSRSKTALPTTSLESATHETGSEDRSLSSRLPRSKTSTNLVESPSKRPISSTHVESSTLKTPEARAGDRSSLSKTPITKSNVTTPTLRTPDTRAKQASSGTKTSEQKDMKESSVRTPNPRPEKSLRTPELCAEKRSSITRSVAMKTPETRVDARSPKTETGEKTPAKEPNAGLTALSASPELSTHLSMRSRDNSSTATVSIQPSQSSAIPSDIKQEISVVWKCFEPNCKYLGTDELHKMQNHLSFHGLEIERIHELSGNLLSINANLRMASRTLYKNSVGTVIGAGPQTYVAPPQDTVHGYTEYECLGAGECKMSFSTESSLLQHCRNVHSSIFTTGQAGTSQLEKIGGGYKCLMKDCSRIQQCSLNSLLFKTHWMSHPGADFKELAYLDLESGRILHLDDIYPYSGQCSVCREICISTVSMADVGQLVGLHWKLVHGDQAEDCSYNALSCKQSLDLPSLLSPQHNLAQGNLAADMEDVIEDMDTTKGLDPATFLERSEDVLEDTLIIKEEITDPILFSGPFKCRFSSCKQILDDAQAVFRHCTEQHSGVSIQKMQVMHLESKTTFPNIALYKYVFECNYGRCKWFTYRNSSFEDAEALLKNHWKRKHKKASNEDYSFNNLSLEHSQDCVPASVDVELTLQKNLGPLYEGPFECTALNCKFTTNTPKSFGRHWNFNHPENPATAAFVDAASGNIVTLFDMFVAVMQCKICKVISTASDGAGHAIEGIGKHINNVHPGANVQDSYIPLKDKDGLHLETLDKACKEVSYRLAISEGLINNGRIMENYVGPYTCLAEGCSALPINKKHILRHWYKEHGDFSKFLVSDAGSGNPTPLTCHDLFKCLAVCPDCNLMVGNNFSYEQLYRGLKQHCIMQHKTEPMDFTVLVPQDKQIIQDDLLDIVEGLDTEDYFSTIYTGPYHCLNDGCEYVCKSEDKKQIGVILTDHWQNIHGSPTHMLYYAETSRAVLNAKVICVHLAQCRVEGCGKYFPSVFSKHLQMRVSLHWSRSHRLTDEEKKNKDKLIQHISIQSKIKRSGIKDRVEMIVQNLTNKERSKNSNPVTPRLEKSNTKSKPAPGPSKTIIPSKPHPSTSKPDPKPSSSHLIQSIEPSPAQELFLENDDEEEREEDYNGYDGPFECVKCKYRVQLNAVSNKNVIQHWSTKHGFPAALKFLDIPTQDILSLENFFSFCLQCTSVGCNYIVASNHSLYKGRFKMKQHFKKDHADSIPDKTDDMYIVMAGEDVLSDISCPEVVDPSMVYKGPWSCRIKGCDLKLASQNSWKMKLLNHFILEHDELFIGDFKVRDEGLKRDLNIQHVFKFVGQCNVDGCFMIRGVGGRNENDGRYELKRRFAAHFNSEHPTLVPDFTVLVHNHQVLFYKDQEDGSTRVLPVPVPPPKENLKTEVKVEPENMETEEDLKEKEKEKERERERDRDRDRDIEKEKAREKKDKRRSAAPLETTQKEASKRRRTIASTCEITSPSTLSTPQTITTVKPKAGKGAPMFQCEVCRADVSKDDFIEHVVQVHPSLDPTGCRVLRLNDEKFLNIKEFLGSVYRCGVLDCNYVNYGKGNNTIRDMHLHYQAQHGTLSPTLKMISQLGYQCIYNNCWNIARSKDDMFKHLLTHTEIAATQIPFRDLDTHADLYIHNLYKYVRECEAKCGQIFYDDKDKKGVDKAAEDHWNELHTLMPVLPDTAPTSEKSGFQCFAGYGGEGSNCTVMVGSGNTKGALEHWQEEHQNLVLRDLMFMDTLNQHILQISDIFPVVYRCTAPGCMKTVYSEQERKLNPEIESIFREHSSVKHQALQSKQKLFRALKTTKFLSQGLEVEEEQTVLEAAQKTSTPEEGVEPPTEAILGYSCSITGCDKTVSVSNSQGSSVAIDRLKSHYKNKHSHLESNLFSYKPIYGNSECTVYRCPNRSCTEASVYYDVLRVHWESKHREYADATFNPSTVNVVTTLACRMIGCKEKKLDSITLDKHVLEVHSKHEETAVRPAEEMVEEPMVPVGRSTSKSKSLSGGSAAGRSRVFPTVRRSSTGATRTSSEAGRTSAKKGCTGATKIPAGNQLRCCYEGCEFTTPSRRDLAQHRREERHSKISRLTSDEGGEENEETEEYICKLKNCGARVVGLRRIEDHCENMHRDRLVEEWIYQKVEKSSCTASSLTFASTAATTATNSTPNSTRKRRYEHEQVEEKAPPEKRRKEVRRTEDGTRKGRDDKSGSVLNCDLGGNFDYSSIDLSGEESDDLDINFY